jgi:flagellar L-ring protein precursor FlgH
MTTHERDVTVLQAPRHARAGLALVLLAVTGCASRGGSDAAPAASAPPPGYAMVPVAAPNAGGAIYDPASALLIFHDVKARRVGDVLTVILNERTQASKSNSTDASKQTSLDTGIPVLLGNTVTRNGLPLTNSVESNQAFNGKGASSQSNRLDGNLTVTVTEVLPNGNLRIAGEKRLTLNQGEEFIKVEGIVRTTDISTDNTVSSLEIADAKISYSGKGPLQDANRPGLLTRMFLRFWPL